MQGTLNATGILGVASATVILLVRFFRKPDGVWQVLGGVAVAVLAAGVSALTALHGCGAGSPLFQWVVPSLCAACTFIFVDLRKMRRVLGTLFAVSALLLSFHYVYLVHTAAYTGNPKWEERLPREPGEKVQVDRLWHTTITGLYSKKRT